MRSLLSILAIGVCGAAATAQPVLSFGFGNTSADFTLGADAGGNPTGDSSVGLFQLSSNLGTTGYVTLYPQVADLVASFDEGFAGGLSQANFELDLFISGISDGANSVDAIGSFTITDVDGDTITGTVEGVIEAVQAEIAPGVFTTFGVISTPTVSDVQFSDGTDVFNGTSGDVFAPPSPDQLGAGLLTLLSLDFRFGGFFTRSFSDASVEVTGQVIPTPGTLGLAAIGGLAMARRRRR